MSPRDLVYVGHMLDMARKAVGKVRVFHAMTEDLPKLVESLDLLVPPTH